MIVMLKKKKGRFAVWFLTVFLLLVVCVSDNDFSNCHCDDEGIWSVHNILEYQKVSDFLIAVAYFSIPIELLYFITCSNVPFKWVLFQFIAFIVLCGLTHLLNGWTYYGPHTFRLMMALTISKILTALVSCATAITLLTLIPILLKIKVRELFLRQNVIELDQEVGYMKKQKEASLHVRMLTQEIRKSLDKHTVLYTTLVELSKTLDLQNCAVWMPNNTQSKMNLTHELKSRTSNRFVRSLPMDDPDILEIRSKKGARILRSDSPLGAASSGEFTTNGGIAAIRMPMLRVSNFKGGTPEFVETSYALLVLVLRSDNEGGWSDHEMQIVEVVADQVAVALSHASVLEESQSMREELEERNRDLQQAKAEAMMANQARNRFQKVMSHTMRRPMHSVIGLLSAFEHDSLTNGQRIITETIMRTSDVLSTLINDVVEISVKDDGRFPLEMRPFRLHPMIKEACCLIKCLCIFKGFGFLVDVQNSLPNQVVGDDRRTFQVLLHMVGHLLDVNDNNDVDGLVIFRVASDSTNDVRNNAWGGGGGGGMWRQGNTEEFVSIKFEIEINKGGNHSKDASIPMIPINKHQEDIAAAISKKGMSFRLCKKIVQMMQGNIWISSKQGHTESMTLVLKFQIQPFLRSMLEFKASSEQPSNSIFRGLRVLVADDDVTNRLVTKKLLEKLGCLVSVVSSGPECLARVDANNNNIQNSVQVLILDLHMPDMDGFEVAMKIRRFPNHTWPLIIALTASAEDQLWEKCLQVRMNGLLRKPVLLQQIAEELRRAIQLANDQGVVI
ncbi:protein EIN4-like [Impatiens glandulifera]|uniref:protein EIN4-like n=1 Tax=Impatiens glandulifera TaxID=253017 RepID=UPI001FB10357|nr:protein EIN4-like [Impatiens glandulifera]